MSKIFSGITLGTLAIAATIISSNSSANASKKLFPSSQNSILNGAIAQTTTLTTTQVEESVFQKINAYRQSQGLLALTRHSTIDTQARSHSENMASGKVAFGHTGFQQRIQTIALTIPLTAAGENVAWNQGYSDPATVAVNGWLKSSGHLANIKGNFNLTGIGVAKNSKGAYYFTQIFIKSR